MTIVIDRAFVRTSAALIHYRSAGSDTTGPPLVLLHGGPGSSAGFAGMMATLASDRRIIAPDTAGCGDSQPLPDGTATIARYAEVLVAVLDHLQVAQADIYGHHTGAQIACEVAIAAPDRVGRLIFDGVGLFPHDLRQEFLAQYAPPIVPAADGSHLLWLWRFANELTRYFPHYADDDAHRVVPEITQSPEAATRIVAEVLKVWPTWHRAYEAAFRHDMATRLPRIGAETLVLRVAGDPLSRYAATAAGLLPHGRLLDVTRDQRPEAIANFLQRSG